MFHIHVHQSASISVDQTLRKFWELEEVPTKNFLTKQELECGAHFAETHKKDSNGRYVVRLPFIEHLLQLRNSFNIVLSSLSRLENKLVQDDVLAVKYRDFLREYESLDHMSCLLTIVCMWDRNFKMKSVQFFFDGVNIRMFYARILITCLDKF